MTTSGQLCFEVREEIDALADGVSAVCSHFPDDYWTAHDQASSYPSEFVEAMTSGGWLGITIPEAYGDGGPGFVAGAAILRAIAESGGRSERVHPGAHDDVRGRPVSRVWKRGAEEGVPAAHRRGATPRSVPWSPSPTRRAIRRA